MSTDDAAAARGSVTSAASVVAVIVLYHPDRASVLETVARLHGDIAALVVFANSALDADLDDELRAAAGTTRIILIRPGDNVGLGAAYNAAVDVAIELDARYLLLLDQDSMPGEAMVPKLVAVAGALEAAGAKPALVGPLPITEQGAPFK